MVRQREIVAVGQPQNQPHFSDPMSSPSELYQEGILIVVMTTNHLAIFAVIVWEYFWRLALVETFITVNSRLIAGFLTFYFVLRIDFLESEVPSCYQVNKGESQKII